MSPPNDRTARARLVVVGLAIIVLFAIVGVVSAGIFLGNKISGSAKSSAPPAAAPTTAPAVLQDVRQARARATEIVHQARLASSALARQSTARARAQATAIVADAKRQAATIASSQPAGSGSSGSGTSSGALGTTGGTGSSGSPGGGAIAGTAPPLNSGGLPASWKVVAYDASFGTGPGVGTVAVLNRSDATFSGTVKIAYSTGGAAYALFTNLPPGASEVLELAGTPYPGGGYTILVPTIR